MEVLAPALIVLRRRSWLVTPQLPLVLRLHSLRSRMDCLPSYAVAILDRLLVLLLFLLVLVVVVGYLWWWPFFRWNNHLLVVLQTRFFVCVCVCVDCLFLLIKTVGCNIYTKMGACTRTLLVLLLFSFFLQLFVFFLGGGGGGVLGWK